MGAFSCSTPFRTRRAWKTTTTMLTTRTEHETEGQPHHGGRAYVVCSHFSFFFILTTFSEQHEHDEEGPHPSRHLPCHHLPQRETEGSATSQRAGVQCTLAFFHFSFIFIPTTFSEQHEHDGEGPHPPRHLPCHHLPPSHET